MVGTAEVRAAALNSDGGITSGAFFRGLAATRAPRAGAVAVMTGARAAVARALTNVRLRLTLLFLLSSAFASATVVGLSGVVADLRVSVGCCGCWEVVHNSDGGLVPEPFAGGGARPVCRAEG